MRGIVQDALAAVGLGIVLVNAASAQAPAPSGPTTPPSCEEQLPIVLRHDQDLQQQRNQLEIRVASLQAQLDAVTAKLHAAEAKLPKSAPPAAAKPASEGKK